MIAKIYDWAFHGADTPTILYEEFMEDMPYGTSKARTGDPDNWLADHFDQVIDRYFYELRAEAELRGENPIELRTEGEKDNALHLRT